MDLNDGGDINQDVPLLPHYEAGRKKTLYRRTLWVGPRGTFTPFHKDPYIGLYSQSKPFSGFMLFHSETDDLAFEKF